jgi:hypothetical protein
MPTMPITRIVRRVVTMRGAITVAVATVIASSPSPLAAQQRTAERWSGVEQALGRKGTMQPGEVLRFSFPRSDLDVTVDGVVLAPAFALGSWVAFRDVGPGQTMVMGDLVLTEDEVGPVMQALQAGGIEQTALHKHVLRESPRIMYMHVAAHGDAQAIARTVRGALAATRTPTGVPAAPAAASAADLDTAGIARALGTAGKLNGMVYQVSVPRRETIREDGHVIPPAMGTAIAMNFQPTGGGKAAITGDFVMRASEVNPVIRALRGHGIEVTALHNHMLTEEPRLFFMHFWANDDAVSLARGLRAALDQTAARAAAKTAR